jgi:hypothetical protein
LPDLLLQVEQLLGEQVELGFVAALALLGVLRNA